MLKRWLKNISWLLNHPPTFITRAKGESLKCSYCGEHNNGTNYYDNGMLVYSLCYHCRKKAFDKILKEEQNANGSRKTE